MNLTEERITVKSADDLCIVPIGDIHVGNVCFDRKYFEEMIDWIIKTPNTYTIGMGDYIDAVIHLDVSRYDIECVDPEFNTPEKQYNYIKKWLGKLSSAGKLWFILEGNHEYEIRHRYGHEHCSRWSIDLGVPFLGVQGMMRLTLEESASKKENMHKAVYDVFAHHGHGGGKNSGAVVNKIQEFARSYDADIYLCGHTHKKSGLIEGRWKINTQRSPDGKYNFGEHKVAFVNTGTFMDSFKPGIPSTYAERKGLPPTVKGVVKIILNSRGDIHLRP